LHNASMLGKLTPLEHYDINQWWSNNFFKETQYGLAF
jgi:hypothetical protein